MELTGIIFLFAKTILGFMMMQNGISFEKSNYKRTGPDRYPAQKREIILLLIIYITYEKKTNQNVCMFNLT